MIRKLGLRHFRNHASLELKIDQPFVYIHGPNGSGKTSILESIYFLATTKSHRTTEERELIERNEPFAQVKIQTDDARYDITLSKTGKHAAINGVEKRKLSDYIGHLRVVMFAPEDLDLIKGSPQERRQFMDLEWMQMNKGYLRQLNTYKHVLKQRNSLLKKIGIEDDFTFLNILGDQLYESGSEIIRERRQFLSELNDHFQKVYALFSHHQVCLKYGPDQDEKGLRQYLSKQQKHDILVQSTGAGPHRDDFAIDFNGFDAKSYASQGEQRLIVIALKLALLRLIESKTGKSVILLLDDVLSELDKEKQALFLEQLPKEHQIIMNSAFPIEGSHIQMVHLKKE